MIFIFDKVSSEGQVLLHFIKEQYDNEEFENYDDELQKIVSDLSKALKDNAQYRFDTQRFNSLGLSESKIKLIEDKWKQISTDYIKTKRLQDKYGDQYQFNPQLCQMIESIDDNDQLLGDNPKRTLDQIVGFISNQKIKELQDFLREKNLSDSSFVLLNTQIRKEYFNELLISSVVSDTPSTNNSNRDLSSFVTMKENEIIQILSLEIIDEAKFQRFKKEISLILDKKQIEVTDEDLKQLIVHSMKGNSDEVNEILDRWNFDFNESETVDTIIATIFQNEEEKAYNKEEQLFNAFIENTPKDQQHLKYMFPLLMQALISENKSKTNEFVIQKMITLKNLRMISQQLKSFTGMNELLLNDQDLLFLEFLIDKIKEVQSIRISTKSYKKLLEKLKSNDSDKKDYFWRQMTEWNIPEESKQQIILEQFESIFSQSNQRDLLSQEQQQPPKNQNKVSQPQEKHEQILIEKREEELIQQREESRLLQQQKWLQSERNRLQSIQLSKQFEILDQKDDYCLDQISSKIVVNTSQIVKMIQTLKADKCRCIGFYGDFRIAYRIISQMYPKIEKIDLESYRNPLKDKLVGYSDGENIFLIYQENDISLECNICDGDDGILYIRFLLDSCSIIVLCLNEVNALKWSDKIPFVNFESTTPPIQIQDKSRISLNQIKTRLLDQDFHYKVYSSLDNNNILYAWNEREVELMNSQEKKQEFIKIEKNYNQMKKFCTDYFKKQSQKGFSLLLQNKKDILNIFNKCQILQKMTENLFDSLENKFKSLIIFAQSDNHPQNPPNKPQQKGENDENPGLQNVSFDIYDGILSELDAQKKKCVGCFNKQSNCKQCMNLKYFVGMIEIYYNQKFFPKVNYSIFQIKQKKFKQMSREEIIHKYTKQQNQFLNKLQKRFVNPYFNEAFQHEWQRLKELINLKENVSVFLTEKSDENDIIDIFNKVIVKFAIQSLQLKVSCEQDITNSFSVLVETFNIDLLTFFEEYTQKKVRRIHICPLTNNYKLNQRESLVGSVQNLKDIGIPDQAHEIVDYISFDDNIDYLITCNSRDPVQMITVWIVERKKRVQPNQIFKIGYQVPGSGVDFCIHINPKSNQWIIFDNKKKKQSIGRVNKDYTFQEGRLPINVFNAKISGCQHHIERVDRCFFLNNIVNYFFIYEQSKNMYYQVSLCGKVQVKEFKLTLEVDCTLEEFKDYQIYNVFNDPENEIYVFETEDSLKITNPNYIVKNEIKIDRKKYIGFKLISTESDLILVVIYQDELLTFVLSDYEFNKCFSIEQSSLEVDHISEQKEGNLIIDKLIRAVQYYGQNFVELGCPSTNHLLCYYENPIHSPKDLSSKIKAYFNDCFEKLSLNYSYKNEITDNSSDSTKIIESILSKIEKSEFTEVSKLKFILLTRIPIQLTTIQQSNYIPLCDGFFKKEILTLKPTDDSQIDLIKDKITFGQYDYLFNEMEKQPLYIVSMCGKQSVGKSSQLNKMFGTRFGVSAARCTDGVWLGYTIIQGKQILVLDCEGLFSVKRTEAEETKLLQQITLISDVSIVLSDLEGISKPMLDLFRKLEDCVGKQRGEGIYFQGAFYFLIKNIQDNGDRSRIESEFKSIVENNNQIKNILQSLCKGRISYGYLKHFYSKEYDSNLKHVRNEGILKYFINNSSKSFNSKQTLSHLKYSVIQIFLDDDTDIKQEAIENEIKEDTLFYKDAFLNPSKMKITEEAFVVRYSYQPSKREQSIVKEGINDVSNPNFQNEEEEEEQKSNKLEKIKQSVIFNQMQLSLDQEDDINIFFNQLEASFLKCRQLESIFEINYKALQRIDHNNYYHQLQKFIDTVLQQRKEVVTSSYENKLLLFKNSELISNYKLEFYTFIDQIIERFQICKKQCKLCDRICVYQRNHLNDCNCSTSHVCSEICQVCSLDEERTNLNVENLPYRLQINNLQCSLKSGHLGTHLCSTKQHLCGQKCQISSDCTATCKLSFNHEGSDKHNCQEKHQCRHKCRLYDKCKKSCKLQSDHEEDQHICDSEICFDKCTFCGKQCQFPRHDHDHLIKDIETNREYLKKIVESEDGSKYEVVVTDHLCGEVHTCKQKCEKEGICKIKYEAEERPWNSQVTYCQFNYTFQKPISSVSECTRQIPKWQKSHQGSHQCDVQHRCDQQCPDCSSFCTHYHNHPGNHETSNHRNKEMCIFVNESVDCILIQDEGRSNSRSYEIGESAVPETCHLSCQRQGRAHYHLKVCKSEEECASKLYPNYARHSDKQYFPYHHIKYDEILCEGYWKSFGWETPLSKNKELEKQVGMCNYACTHLSHTNDDDMNYCNKKAWHSNEHQIDTSKCSHKILKPTNQIDICFTIDSTLSMGFAFAEVKHAVQNIIDWFKDTELDLLFAIVCYRDHPPQDYSFGDSGVKIYDFTNEREILKIIPTLTADGGGDPPENVICALQKSCTKLKWRPDSGKFIFHICDSPPHGSEYGCASKDLKWTKNGCPCGIERDQVAKSLADNDIMYYLIKCSQQLNKMETLFSTTFKSNFRQSTEINERSEINIIISTSVLKEIKRNAEFYIIKANI